MFKVIVDSSLDNCLQKKEKFLKSSSMFKIDVDISLENILEEKIPQIKLHV